MCCASFYALAQSIPPVSDPHCAYCNVNLRTATSHKSGCPYYVAPSSTSSEAYSSSGGKSSSREEIYDAVWGQDVVVGSRTLDVHIRHLRTKIGDNHISTYKGVGFRYEE